MHIEKFDAPAGCICLLLLLLLLMMLFCSVGAVVVAVAAVSVFFFDFVPFCLLVSETNKMSSKAGSVCDLELCVLEL